MSPAASLAAPSFVFAGADALKRDRQGPPEDRQYALAYYSGVPWKSGSVFSVCGPCSVQTANFAEYIDTPA